MSSVHEVATIVNQSCADTIVAWWCIMQQRWWRWNWFLHSSWHRTVMESVCNNVDSSTFCHLLAVHRPLLKLCQMQSATQLFSRFATGRRRYTQYFMLTTATSITDAAAPDVTGTELCMPLSGGFACGTIALWATDTDVTERGAAAFSNPIELHLNSRQGCGVRKLLSHSGMMCQPLEGICWENRSLFCFPLCPLISKRYKWNKCLVWHRGTRVVPTVTKYHQDEEDKVMFLRLHQHYLFITFHKTPLCLLWVVCCGFSSKKFVIPIDFWYKFDVI